MVIKTKEKVKTIYQSKDFGKERGRGGAATFLPSSSLLARINSQYNTKFYNILCDTSKWAEIFFIHCKNFLLANFEACPCKIHVCYNLGQLVV